MTTNPYESPRYPQEPLPKQAPLDSDAGQSLSVEFDLTLDDYVAFNVVHRSHAVLMKRILIIVLGIAWISIPLYIGVELYQNWAGHLPNPLDPAEVSFKLLYAVVHTILFPLLTWWIYPLVTLLMRSRFQHFWMRIILRWMLSAGDTSSIFGRYKLTISPAVLHEQGPKNETSFKMSAVQKLVATNQYLFIYVSPLQAYIIPSRVFGIPGDFLQFVRTIEEWTQLKAVR